MFLKLLSRLGGHFGQNYFSDSGHENYKDIVEGHVVFTTSTFLESGTAFTYEYQQYDREGIKQWFRRPLNLYHMAHCN